MVWDPKRIARVSWAEAAAFYRNLEDRNAEFQPLRALVDDIGTQPWAASLGAATSGTALLVAPLDTAEWAASCLRIDVALGGNVQLTAPGRPSFTPAERFLGRAFELIVREAGWIRSPVPSGAGPGEPGDLSR